MKKNSLFGILIFISFSSDAQVLLEDKDGDVIVRNQFAPNTNTALIKLNTGDQSLGFNYILSTKLNDANKYDIQEFGVKAKPTEGYASVFSNGQFSPGIKFSYAYTKVRIFSKRTIDPFIDWANIELNYNINKYTLYDRSQAFGNQFYAKSFRGINALVNYNLLITSGGRSINSKLLLSLKGGYSRRNNNDDLTAVTVTDIKSVTDAATGTERQITRTKNLKEGSFETYDAYPLVFALTKLTPTDAATDDNAKKMRLGYTAYFKNLISDALPDQRLGVIFFLTKQDDSGIRNPVFGLDIQAADPFDVNHSGTDVQSRVSVGFTTIFSL